jgi:TonB family protein
VSQVRQRFLPSLLVAGAIHGAGFGWLATRPPPTLPQKRPPTTVRLVARERPPPAPAPPPAAEPPRPRTPPRVAAVRPAAPEPAPAPAAPPQPGPPPQPRRFAVSMNAVVPGGAGGVAVPVTEGTTAARGNPNAPASAPVGDNVPFARAAPVDAVDVDTAPRLLRGLSAAELRARYPEAARAARLEADVRLELTIDEAGAVTSARVLAPAGGGFDEAAVEAVRAFRFAPATRNGRPLAVRLPWVFKYRLDE